MYTSDIPDGKGFNSVPGGLSGIYTREGFFWGGGFKSAPDGNEPSPAKMSVVRKLANNILDEKLL